VNYAFEHPGHGFGAHPWDSPLSSQDPLAPFPGIELASLAGTGPRPEQFPFDANGRRAYYQAVRDEAAQRQQMQILEQRRREQEQREEEIRQAGLLLL